MSLCYLSLSGNNLSVKPIAGQEEKVTLRRLSELKTTFKTKIFDKGKFSHWEYSKDSLPLLFKEFGKENILIDKKAQEFVDHFEFSQIPLKELPKERLTVLPLDRELYEHQEQFASYSFKKRNILTFDETGTGKLCALVIRAANIGFERLLVVTTKANFDDWERDCRAILDTQPLKYEGTPKQREKIDLSQGKIILTNYEQVKKILDHPGADQFDGLIMDEIHNASQPGTKTFKNLKSLQKLNKFKFKMGSTATPVDGQLSPLWGVIHLVDPLLAGDHDDFIKRFQEPIQFKEITLKNGHKYKQAIRWKTKNSEDLKQILSCIAHRSNAGAKIFKNKPPKSDIIPLKMTTQQRDAYEMILENIRTELADGTFYEDNPMVKLGKLFKVTSGIFEDGHIYSSKYEWTCDQLREAIKKGERLAVWSAYVDPLKAYWDEFKEYGVLYIGEKTQTYKKMAKIAFAGAKDKEEEQFWTETLPKLKDFPFEKPGTAPFFFGISARRASEGLNLPCQRQIYHAVSVSSRVTKQTLGRTQRANADYDYFLTQYPAIVDSADVRYINLVLTKMKKNAELLDGKDSEITIRAAEIVNLLGLKTSKRARTMFTDEGLE
jgi:SNF2 family DNA or RNA helicase